MSSSSTLRRAREWYAQNKGRLPTEPFQLAQGETVSNPARFYARIDSMLADSDSLSPQLREAYILKPLRQLRRVLEGG